MSDPHASPLSRNSYHLTSDERAAIGARLLAGYTKTKIAKELNLARSTVLKVAKRLQVDKSNGAELDIRARLQNLNSVAADAIQASMQDREDVHKAAVTSIQHLKGMGVYASDNNVSANVIVQVAALPEDWRDRYIGPESDVENKGDNG